MPLFRPSDILLQLPILLLVLGGLILVLTEAFSKGENKSALGAVAAFLAAVAAVSALVLSKYVGGGEEIMRGMLYVDKSALVLTFLFAAIACLTALIAPLHQRMRDWQQGEFYGLLLFSTAGMAILAAAADLITVFLGIEMMSLAVYAMTASRRRSISAVEAAMKYFLMGAFATAIMLFGMVMVFGATGQTGLDEIGASIGALNHTQTALLVMGSLFLVISFGFKVAAVPFHMWTPDAYQGAPAPVTGFMAAAVKAAVVAGMIRVFSVALGGDIMPFGKMGWGAPMVILAAASMLIGNIAALRQDNIKRMLAYSSIAHGGVLLVGLAALGLGAAGDAHAAILFYLIAYSFTTVGAFAVVTWMSSQATGALGVGNLISDYNGLSKKHPTVALMMLIFMLSLGGIPPTGGFFAKFLIFKAGMQTVDAQLLWLVVFGVLNSAIAIFYYLKVVMAMYFKNAIGELELKPAPAITVCLAICALLVMYMGLLPGSWLGLIQ